MSLFSLTYSDSENSDDSTSKLVYLTKSSKPELKETLDHPNGSGMDAEGSDKIVLTIDPQEEIEDCEDLILPNDPLVDLNTKRKSSYFRKGEKLVTLLGKGLGSEIKDVKVRSTPTFNHLTKI